MTLITRRNFGLGAMGAAAASLMTGAGGTASGSRRFLFVHAQGGWDPLCVFAPMFSAPQIEMEAGTTPLTVGNFNLVGSPLRPAVEPFFQRWGDRTLLLNGLNTRSVNHQTCQAVALTGATSDGGVDWPTLLAVEEAPTFYLPHVVLGGPAFAGSQTVHVSRAEGLVQQAITGELLSFADMPVLPPSAALRDPVDAHLALRAQALAAKHPELRFAEDYELSVTRSQELVAADLVQFPQAETMREQGANAIQVLSDGISRCATISAGFNWDTHADNSLQTGLFNELFSDLDFLLDALENTPTAEGCLADETVVVVLSEMARTPAYNATTGRDHWPFTSAMIIGPGITGGRTIGGYTDNYTGIGVDPATGEADPSQSGIDAKTLGATLLALGDVDPAAVIPGATPISAVLA